MLAQSLPPDLEKRIEQVASVVHGRTGDEISVALHDNDYDPDRAVAALLDEDSGNVTVSGCGVCGGAATSNTLYRLALFVLFCICLCVKQLAANLY